MLVNQLIREADIVLEVLDARMVQETRNKEIEDKIARSGKKLIYVVTKCDLAGKEHLEKVKKELTPSIFVSATKHYGTSMLLQKIMQISKGEDATVAVVGYPNVGKSSVINALKGRQSASVSSTPGHTKGIQKIKINKKIYLIDSPGVLAYQENDVIALVLTGSKDPARLKDPELAAMRLLTLFLEQDKKAKIEEAYQITLQENEAEPLLEEIAMKKHRLKKGNIPDTETTARILLHDWQKGKLLW